MIEIARRNRRGIFPDFIAGVVVKEIGRLIGIGLGTGPHPDGQDTAHRDFHGLSLLIEGTKRNGFHKFLFHK
jgi:hypothetical protein